MTNNISDISIWAKEELESKGIENADHEVRILLSEILNKKPVELIQSQEKSLDPSQTKLFEMWIKKRKARVPLPYLIHNVAFLNYSFFVDPRVFIPRPETEELVEWASLILKRKEEQKLRILELGTGSGCISISLALQNPTIQVLATDRSEEALAVAKMNAKRYTLNDRVRFLESDLFKSLERGSDSPFDMIISNPPYVATGEATWLSPEVIYEPKAAIFSGKRGLDCLTSLIKDSPNFLKPGGTLLVEIGFQQAKAVKSLFEKYSFKGVQVIKDLSGHDRIAQGQWHG